ncbi:unnamed protein product [Albugo candida]|uniref:Uncharacterized protein n=1 Tax=Albugo candida TaxID=65357 RepID=A0A024G6S2_9STRA|nr:unnamed protein product [Albugo candida]|eukprot:CCI42428.1 unnamed protein product [Albugo candida]
MNQHLRRISTADHHRYNASIGTPWRNTITHLPGHPPPHLIHRISAVPPTLLPPKLQGIYRPIRPPLQRPFIIPFSPEMESKWLNEFRAKHLRYSEERLGQRAPRLDVFRAIVRKMLQLTEELARKGRELMEIEKEQKLGFDTVLHEKRNECENVKQTLETLRKQTIDLDENKMRILTGYLRRIQKKKNYRKRKRHRLCELNRSKEPESRTESPSEDIDKHSSKSQLKVEDNEVIHSKSTVKAARMVLMLLDIKAKRQGMNLQELEKLKHEARQIVRSQSSTNTPNSSQDAKPSSDTTSKSRIRILFKDPKTIDFDELVTIRRAWDQHLVPPGTTPGSSRIPPHFVVPPSKPSPFWARYLAHK